MTFSRAADGSIKNSSPAALLELLDFLEKNPELGARVDGFDFCGFENPIQIGPTLELLQMLTDYNVHYSGRKSDRKYKISIHAGENCFDWSSADHLNAFEQLYPLTWDMLGHGTFLWLPSALLAISKAEDAARQKLLRAYAQKDITFEICPTSNIFLTPMLSGADFPTQRFLSERIPFTVNPDDATLFSTTYDRELALIGLKR